GGSLGSLPLYAVLFLYFSTNLQQEAWRIGKGFQRIAGAVDADVVSPVRGFEPVVVDGIVGDGDAVTIVFLHRYIGGQSTAISHQRPLGDTMVDVATR